MSSVISQLWLVSAAIIMAASLAGQSVAVFSRLSAFISFVTGESLFLKYYGYRLPEVVSTVRHIRTVLLCEMLCLEAAQQCAAANVIYVKGDNYICEMFTALPKDYTHAKLIRNERGKFIRRREFPETCLWSPCQNGGSCQNLGSSFLCICPPLYKGVYCQLGPHKLAIHSCAASSIESGEYLCENAYDGVLDPGDGNEWSGVTDDKGIWLRLDFRFSETVAMLKIWWRCSGDSQFSELTISFSDGSSQRINHQCSTESNWLGCTADDPEEVFYLVPVSTTYVNISGVDCVPDMGNNGFREVEIWSP